MNQPTLPLQTPAPAQYHSIFRGGLFQGRTLWVTGGGSGIGRCVAHELASLGARVVISGRTQEKLDRVAQEIRDDGGQCETQAFDIRDEDAVKTAVAAVVARVGRIDGLVNNAGGQFPAPLQAISKRGFEAVVSNNLTGGFLMMREVFLQSMQEHGGAIVNMTADFRNGMPGMGHSGAARAGMSNLTMSAAFEWAQAGVRVNAVSPGWVASSGMDSYEGPVRAMIKKLRQHVPMRRLATEAEISAAIVFLLSPGAAFISGVTLQIDGAASLGSPVFPTMDHDRCPPFEGFHRAQTPEVLNP
ncbi:MULTISPECIES: SDR family oxidoreductase [unclassified Simplicispira]|jgi:citronellol/citronellal dehydrogenase|uniref:SDR family oxidoreductase n=1 Tax=unclassified Simplicispira TaxID=2630407 RepID=UPI000D5D11C3|nr:MULTISPECIES: SDR family oxidoreductase [unclassified Simplicispira]MBH1977379.1 SDR family oxidoreductase [Comamonadaceae bacterium]PVY55099.1 citronellol/citronellal dehydrogenase [Simplicispira sp. 125]REG16042.1 citronellol/citronellal dehydrogenase [Simplicispira sp. 110]